VERGIIILIGATTENPFFEVNKALLSRTMVIVLQSLKEKDLEKLYTRALQDEKIGLGRYKVVIDPDAKEYLFTISQGDGRILLNSLEIGVLSTDPDSDGVRRVNLDSIKESIQVKTAKYDKGGDEHYSTISAFIKSFVQRFESASRSGRGSVLGVVVCNGLLYNTSCCVSWAIGKPT
jgi:putative ATPase